MMEEDLYGPCPHDWSFDLQVGFHGDLWYACQRCHRQAHFTEGQLKKMIRHRLNTQMERERAQQEQGAGEGA